MLEPTAPSAPPRPEPTVRFALPGEGERVIVELRTAHGNVVQIVQPRLVPAGLADHRRPRG